MAATTVKPSITLDQPLFAIAKQILWNWPSTHGEDQFLVMLGGLHIGMAALKVLGNWLDGSGWTTVIGDAGVDSAGVDSTGVADSFIKASHLARTRRAHQVTAASLYILLHKAHLKYQGALEDGEEPLALDAWKVKMFADHPQFLYWCRVLDLELCVLQLVRSTTFPSILDECSLESYVDDSKLYLPFPVAEGSNMVQQINKDLQKIASWCCDNRLLINPEKTKLLVLGTRQMLQRLLDDFHVILLGKKVTPSLSAWDRGLQVDCTLSYDEHVTQTVSSCIGSLCAINRVKHLFDARTQQRVINASVFSKLYYYSPVWSNTSKKNILKLQKVQNFAGRIITGTRKFYHIKPVLRELRWLPVSSYLRYTLGVLAFKCVKGLAPSYLCDRFKTRATLHDRNTRYKDSLNIPAYKSASEQCTFLYRATNLWNSLPRALINSATIVDKTPKENFEFWTYLSISLKECTARIAANLHSPLPLAQCCFEGQTMTQPLFQRHTNIDEGEGGCVVDVSL